MNRKKDLDRKDLEIISTLDKLGAKTSTKQLGKILNIPDRTIRYRLKNLKENGYLQPLYPLIYDRKLGIGEHIVLLQEVENNKLELTKVVMEIPYFYWINSTFGRYNGILLNSIFSIHTPENNEKLCETLKKFYLIADYFLFDIKYYNITYPNLSLYDPERGWIWDWEKWYKGIKTKLMKNDLDVLEPWENELILAEFDFKDIEIIKFLKQGNKSPLSELCERLDLSKRQIRRRIKRLETENIIKGYISAFTPETYNDDLLTYFFFELKEPNNTIIQIFQELPFQLDIFIESNTNYCITFRASTKDIKGFTKGVDLIKPYLSSSFIQVVPYSISERHHMFEAYDQENKCWKTPIDTYLKRIEGISKK